MSESIAIRKLLLNRVWGRMWDRMRERAAGRVRDHARIRLRLRGAESIYNRIFVHVEVVDEEEAIKREIEDEW